MGDAGAAEHRRFLNRLYGPTRHVYDLTRRFLLPGRDRALHLLLAEPWTTLVEVGPGTGRNLRRLHAARPEARYGGVDACDAMLEHARARLPWATLVHGFAESADLAAVVGCPPDRVLLSYCLSMVQDPLCALDQARRAVAPGGAVVVVDFADLGGLPRVLRNLVVGWLRRFRVQPLGDELVAAAGGGVNVVYGPGRYYLIARFSGLGGGS